MVQALVRVYYPILLTYGPFLLLSYELDVFVSRIGPFTAYFCLARLICNMIEVHSWTNVSKNSDFSQTSHAVSSNRTVTSHGSLESLSS